IYCPVSSFVALPPFFLPSPPFFSSFPFPPSSSSPLSPSFPSPPPSFLFFSPFFSSFSPPPFPSFLLFFLSFPLSF
ncbi:hypothetical protein ACXWRS_12545, partial [Streptococcus pyogenes]